VRRRRVLVVLVLLAATAIAVPYAFADGGGLKPSQAPLVTVGQHYFGSTDHAANRGNWEYDFWALPALIRADVVTVSWTTSSNAMCIFQSIDDYSWGDIAHDGCNGSEVFDVSGSGSSRSRLAAKASSASSYLTFYTCCSGHPYDFTVESIQHSIGLALKRTYKALSRTGSIKGTAALANGTPVPDGLVFMLTTSWRGGRSVSQAASQKGKLVFKLHLPQKAHGKKASFVARYAQSAGYLAAHSATIKVKIR
jgi:hypothetical protein